MGSEDDFMRSFEEDLEFDLSFENPNPIRRTAEAGQVFVTDGSGRGGWGGFPYVIFERDNFNKSTVDRLIWTTKTGANAGTISGAVGGSRLYLNNGAGTAGETIDLGKVEGGYFIKNIGQVKAEATLYHLGSPLTLNCFFFGWLNTSEPGDNPYIALYQDTANSSAEHFWFACSRTGLETRTEVVIAGEIDVEIAIVVNSRSAVFYKNGVKTATIKTNIAKDYVMDEFLLQTKGTMEAYFEDFFLKSIIPTDSF